MYFYLIIALQGFCIYHLYKSRNNTYWYFIIFFIPVIGSIIYLVTQVFNKQDAEKIQNEISTIINPTKKVRDLEKLLAFSDTFQNRVNLADAFFEIGDFDSAINHYEKALIDYSDNDYHVKKMLVEAYNEVKNFDAVVIHAQSIKSHSEFKQTRTQFLYGLALDKQGETEAAEKHMRAIDQRYSNYNERVILSKFLIHHNKIEDAKAILSEICLEGDHMNSSNRKKYKLAVAEANRLIQSL